MRYVQLRAFHNVAIHGGFSRAAEALSLSQPAISDQVAKLEEEYDVLLFDRHKRRVTLTPFAEQLLEITRHLFEFEKQARDVLSEKQALRSGTLRIIADSPHHLLHVLKDFKSKYPRIFISLGVGNTDQVVSALNAYQADIGVLGEVPADRQFKIVRLNSTPFVAFVARDYPIEKTQSLTIRQIAAHPLVMRETGSKTRQVVERFAASKGVKLSSSIEAEGREAVREIVAAGMGVGFVSSAEFGHDRRLRAVNIEGLGQHMDEALICLKNRENSKLIKTFMGLAAPAQAQ
jgi:LysR family transcriptional regulator, low CO2-responsive transcriptional regulator